jgi:hypothetical protein
VPQVFAMAFNIFLYSFYAISEFPPKAVSANRYLSIRFFGMRRAMYPSIRRVTQPEISRFARNKRFEDLPPQHPDYTRQG